MDIIFNRRSVRNFRNGTISETDIKNLLKAAMRAPSAGNEQPWEFLVIKQRDTMKQVQKFHPYAKMLDTADCLIVVCGNLSRQKFQDDYWVQDCSAATQNLLLEAYSLGLGAVWLGIYPMEERVQGMKALFNLPDNIVPLSAIALGYPETTPEPIDTFKPERIHWESWDGTDA